MSYPVQVKIKADSSKQAMEAANSLNYLSNEFSAKGIINIVKKYKTSAATRAGVKAAATGIL